MAPFWNCMWHQWRNGVPLVLTESLADEGIFVCKNSANFQGQRTTPEKQDQHKRNWLLLCCASTAVPHHTLIKLNSLAGNLFLKILQTGSDFLKPLFICAANKEMIHVLFTLWWRLSNHYLVWSDKWLSAMVDKWIKDVRSLTKPTSDSSLPVSLRILNHFLACWFSLHPVI